MMQHLKMSMDQQRRRVLIVNNFIGQPSLLSRHYLAMALSPDLVILEVRSIRYPILTDIRYYWISVLGIGSYNRIFDKDKQYYA